MNFSTSARCVQDNELMELRTDPFPLRSLSLYLSLLLRLYSRAVHLGYKRSQRKQHEQQSRLQIEGLKDRKDTGFYMGKKVVYIYKAPTAKRTSTSPKKTRYRTIWGKIIAPHGNNGVVKAKFRNNLPPCSIGKPVRVMLYPSNV